MFVDEVVMKVEAGTGGNGCMAFRREACVPMGGPFGGNGGKGSDIIFKADEGLKTLIDLRYQKKIKGNNGENGEGKNKFGSNSEDVIIKVPVGTTVKDADTGVVIADLTKQGEMATIAYGGRGGRGNVSLATRSNPCPSYAEKGEPGEVRNIKVELRMIADVGLVGMPSVGKSTILSMISNANPKIADYHFTTLSPNLGVVKTKDNTFVVADLPGLIEGASEGVGLGIQFLRHVERTRLLLHFIDVSGQEGRKPVQDFRTINSELKKYSEKLAMRKQIIVATKIDVKNEECYQELKDLAEKENLEFYQISSATGDGVQELIDHVANVLKTLPKEELVQVEEKMVYTLPDKEQQWEARREGNVFYVTGRAVDRLMGRINIEDNESMYYFHKCLRNMGIDAKLRSLGICDGDTVFISDWELEWED